MKKLLICLSVLLAGLLPAKAQFGDPYIDINMNPPAIGLGANTTLEVLTGNFGGTPICDNSMIITISAGSNAEIMGIAAGSDPRWTVFGPLLPGAGNTIQLVNTGGTYNPFDLTYVYLTVKGVVLGGPSNFGGNITYILANNPCAGGAPNSAQGNVNIANDNGITSLTVLVVLPLRFVAFDAKANGCSGSVSWTTAEEENVKTFEVQQSFDGVNYTTVKTIPSKGNGGHQYEVSVNQSQKRMQYRVVAIDVDGRKSYGTVQTITLSNCIKASVVQVFPIPAFRDQKVTMQANVNEKITYRLMDISGKTIMTGTFVRTAQVQVLNSGTYLLEMTAASFKETQTIVIQ